MRKIKVALSLIAVALIIFVSVMIMNNWSFKSLSNQEYTTNTYEITDDFENIIINVLTADIEILPSNDDKCKVEAYEEINRTHKIEVVNQRLTITPPKKEIIPPIFNFDSPKITIYLPIKEYQILKIDASTGDALIDKAFSFNSLNIDVTTGDVECYASCKENIIIKTTTGDIVLDNITASQIDLKATTGDVTVKNVNCTGDINVDLGTGKANLTNISCKNLSAKGTTEDTVLNNVIASEKLNIVRTTGDVLLNNCDASEIYIKVTTGDVTGNLLSDKTFDVHTTTGKQETPQTTGGPCKIDATTGDIIITVSQYK